MRGLAPIIPGWFFLGAPAGAQGQADPIRDSYFPLAEGSWWKYRVQTEENEKGLEERTVRLGQRAQVTASYQEKGTASSWRGENVMAWSLAGYESRPAYVVEVDSGMKILAHRRAARGPGGIFTIIPVAVCLWGKDES